MATARTALRGNQAHSCGLVSGKVFGSARVDARRSWVVGIRLAEENGFRFPRRCDGATPQSVRLAHEYRQVRFPIRRLCSQPPAIARQVLRHAECPAAVFVSDAGCLNHKLQDRLACFVERIIGAGASVAAGSLEPNDYIDWASSPLL